MLQTIKVSIVGEAMDSHTVRNHVPLNLLNNEDFPPVYTTQSLHYFSICERSMELKQKGSKYFRIT